MKNDDSRKSRSAGFGFGELSMKFQLELLAGFYKATSKPQAAATTSCYTDDMFWIVAAKD